MKLKYLWIFLLSLGFVACDDDKFETDPTEPVDLVPGDADFSSYVAIGNSLTAGFADGALFIASQGNSFPNLLSGQMSMAGGGEFTQPLMNDNVGGLLLGGNPIPGPFGPRLIFDGSGLAVLPGTPSTEVSNIMPGPYNNMGVPGARSFHLLANGYGNIAGLQAGLANPYFVRMASSPNASVLEDAMAQQPTFFTLWIGSNDVLGYAVAGGSDSDVITDADLFQTAISATIGTLASGGAKGIVANVPDVTRVAFFNTVPHNPLDPTNPEFGPQIPALNAVFAQLNQAFAFLGVPERSVVFSETAASAVLIQDETLANISPQLTQVLIGGGLDPQTATLLGNQFGQSRQATEDDLLVLTSSTHIATLNEDYFNTLVGLGVPPAQAGQLAVNGITYPLTDRWVLLPSEQEEIKSAVDVFNATIEQVAGNFGLPVFDARGLYDQIADSGYSSDGFTLTSQLVTGGIFSLDGLHLTARANAVVANEMMKIIDENYGSNFEEAGALFDIGEFPVIYPAN